MIAAAQFIIRPIKQSVSSFSLDAIILECLRKFSVLVHLNHNIAASYKLALHVHLRYRWPVTVILDALPQLLVLEHIVRCIVLHAFSGQHLYDSIAEATLWRAWNALHVNPDVVRVDVLLDVLHNVIWGLLVRL